MNCSSQQSACALEIHAAEGLHIFEFTQASHTEWFITLVPGEASPPSLFERAASLLRDREIEVVAQEVFGNATHLPLLEKAFGPLSWPVTWIGEQGKTPRELAGTQFWGVSGVPVESVMLGNSTVGRTFQTESARFCRLGGLIPPDPRAPEGIQAGHVFRQMDQALATVGMDFGAVLRTWFFNHSILDWYPTFNQVRDAFFREKGVFDGLVPASTGIAGSNPQRAALAAALLAVQPVDGSTIPAPVPSPLQCPALEYGSAFSRAVELAAPDHRRLFVSGTASIAPEGHTVHTGDVQAQVATTMEVVGAILESRGMNWNDTCRAIAYFKNGKDLPLLDHYLADTNTAPFPVVLVTNDVCRDDLLFEIELDALQVC